VSRRFTEFRIDGSSLKEFADGSIRVLGQLTHPGIFVYRNADGSARREYRPKEEVFRADAMGTFASVPVTIGHPQKGVRADNWKSVAIGHLGENVRQDGENMVAEIYVRDAAAVARVKSGDLRAISCGYEVDFDPTPGTAPDGSRYDGVQRNIRGNHVALLPKGVAPRGGAECVLRLDSEGDEESSLKWDVTPEQIAQMQAENARLAQENAKLRADAENDVQTIVKLTAQVTEAAQRADAASKELSPERIDALVADRTATLALAKSLNVDGAGKSTVAVKRLIVAKQTPALAARVDAMDAATLDACIAVAASKPHPTMKSAVGVVTDGPTAPAGGERSDAAPSTDIGAMQARSVKANRESWASSKGVMPL
jgi:hypothetical protein